MHIAVVDPSRAVLKGIGLLLEARDHYVYPFTDGTAALRHIDQNPNVDAAIISAEQASGPGAGIELCWQARLLASSYRPIYVILMSAHDEGQTLSEPLDSGADDFIAKPPLAEELYARNLGNLFVSPLTLGEFIAGQLTMSVVRALIGVGGACVFAYLLFRYSIFSMGFALIAFFACLLVFGWAIGLAMSGMIMRLGLGAEELAWASIFVVAPVSGVYYPIAVLPGWMQSIAWGLPSAHVFEGMRAVLLHGEFPWPHLWTALGLDVLYVGLGAAVFAWALRYARNHGTLLQMGE